MITTNRGMKENIIGDISNEANESKITNPSTHWIQCTLPAIILENVIGIAAAMPKYPIGINLNPNINSELVICIGYVWRTLDNGTALISVSVTAMNKR